MGVDVRYCILRQLIIAVKSLACVGGGGYSTTLGALNLEGGSDLMDCFTFNERLGHFSNKVPRDG